jgi:hypothetical protein
MRKLGVVRQHEAPDAVSFQRYIRLFAVGLSKEHCTAIRELFGAQVDGSFECSVLEDDEFQAAVREIFPEEQLVEDVQT